MESFGLDRGQIAFRRQVRNNFGERAAEEFAEDPATCFLASGSAVFDTAKIEARMHELGDALESEGERTHPGVAAGGTGAASTFWGWTRRAEARAAIMPAWR